MWLSAYFKFKMLWLCLCYFETFILKVLWCIKIVFDVYRKEKINMFVLYFFDWEALCQCASLFRTGTLQTVTFGGHWQLKVTWSQHYMSLSRHFGVSSINQSSSTQCRKKNTTFSLSVKVPEEKSFPTWQKTLFLVTEHWVWAKMMVFQSAQTTSALHRHHKDGSERSCRIVFRFYARMNLWMWHWVKHVNAQDKLKSGLF